MSYSYENLKERILLTSKSYVLNKNKKEKPVNKNFNTIRYIGDQTYETILEKIIDKLKSEIEINIECDDDIIEEIINQTFVLKEENKYHTGYLQYLLCAWENHWGIEVGPWHLWNILIWNLKEINKLNPQQFRKLWSNHNEKINISIVKNKFDINKVMEVLKNFIPENTIDTLILKFPNAPINYLESIYGLIAEISNDYYNVSILSCNIPKVKVLGTLEEWNMLIDKFIDIEKL